MTRMDSAGWSSWRRCIGIVLVALGLCASTPTEAQTAIANTVHNLTPGGPGQLKETRPTGLCVYCHTPHNADPTIALWNRNMPAVTYQLYTSSTLQATPNQPTGSSRLCLSCHDGILALGNLRVAPPGEELDLGPMTGKRMLGTDLSDDHPISFVYDAELAVQRGELVDPTTLPATVRLDATRQAQHQLGDLVAGLPRQLLELGREPRGEFLELARHPGIERLQALQRPLRGLLHRRIDRADGLPRSAHQQIEPVREILRGAALTLRRPTRRVFRWNTFGGRDGADGTGRSCRCRIDFSLRHTHKVFPAGVARNQRYSSRTGENSVSRFRG